MTPGRKSQPEPFDQFVCEITAAQASITAYIRALLPGNPDFMDVLQEVNITLWNKRTEFRADSNFKAWAFQVARFHVMAARRRLATESGKRVFAERLTDLLADECPYPEEKFDRKLTVLQSCLDQLRDKDRELLRIRYSDASSIDAYARREKRNPATLRATLRRLRETLLRCVNHKLAALPANGESA